MMILASACLVGVNCKYNGENNLEDEVQELLPYGHVIPVCPEQLGGCATPRPPAEIVGGSGEDVLDGKARVMTKNGEDVTESFIKGAKETLAIALAAETKKVILKSNSPSCGCGLIYDGTFTGKLVKGYGVTAAILLRNGIEVTVIC